MNKKDFTRYINEQLEGLSLERQIGELQKVQKTYLPELIQARQKKLGIWVPPEKKQDYMFCESCRKYSLKNKCVQEDITEVRTVTTFRDCGYGDDDKMGDVEYIVTYITCPRCGHKQEKSKFRLRTLREWNRREGRKG
ncbi:MAG: hypothetical protein IJ272_00340 [Clostridia bacterium]|nr:hypothetical protein [Clostridia bacterium]